MAEFTPTTQASLNPELLHQMNFSFVASRVLFAAVRLGVFSQIAAGHKTPRAMAAATGATERGLRMLLDSLATFQLLVKKDARYELTPLAAQFLVRESPDYVGSMLEDDSLWESWTQLAEVIRTGQPVHRVEDQERAAKFFPSLVRGLHVLHREPARRMALALGAGTARQGLRVVDVACGSAVWSIAIAEADPEARLTAQDFAPMLEVARRFLRQHNVEDRYDFLPGDLKQVDFGADRYDVALLGNIVHSEGEQSSRDLFRRLYRALGPGGQLAIMDMVPNDDRTGPPFAVSFALNMLLHTEAGDTYTLAEYTQWLQEAGFPSVETADIGSHSPLVIGRKK